MNHLNKDILDNEDLENVVDVYRTLDRWAKQDDQDQPFMEPEYNEYDTSTDLH